MADQKLTQLTALASLSADDLFYVVDDPAGAANPHKMTASVLDARYLQAANNLSDLANAGTARTNLGLAIGANVQAYDAFLASIAGLGTAADRMIYTTGVDTAAETGLSAFARSFLDDASEAAFKATVNLEIGVDVQAWDADLDTIAGLAKADGNFIVGDGAAWTVESGATVRTSLGLVAGGAGDIWVEKAGDTMTGPLVIDGSSDAKQLVVQGHSTQTQPLQEWQLSTGGVVGYLNTNGLVINKGYALPPIDDSSFVFKIIDESGDGLTVNMYIQNRHANGYSEIALVNDGGTIGDNLGVGIGGTTADPPYTNSGYIYTGPNLDSMLFSLSKATAYYRFDIEFDVEVMRIDKANAASGDTVLMFFDVDNNTVERVSVGAAGSGGAGFKVLRIPN